MDGGEIRIIFAEFRGKLTVGLFITTEKHENVDYSIICLHNKF